MPTDAVGLVSAAVVGAVGVLAGRWSSRRLGLPAAQDELIKTLQGTVDAQAKRIATLEAENVLLTKRVAYLEQVIEDKAVERRRAPRA